jgi:heme-degrading monooxygenase HmoA
MAQLFVHHKVADYAKWRQVYDEMDGIRRQFGMTDAQVLCSASDPNEVVILTVWPTVDHARQYAQSPDLKQGMQKAGVISQPEVLFLEEA